MEGMSTKDRPLLISRSIGLKRLFEPTYDGIGSYQYQEDREKAVEELSVVLVAVNDRNIPLTQSHEARWRFRQQSV
jgi:hypothetical protein